MHGYDLADKVRQAAARAAERQTAVDLADLWDKLSRVDPEDIQEKLENLDQEYWYGAISVWEPAGYTKFSKEEPRPTVGIDGSQIYPDTDEPVLWGYIQAIIFKTSERPAYESEFFDLGTMLAEGIDLPDYQDMRGMLAGGFVEWFNSQRTALELRAGIQAARSYPDDVVLLDNPLLPRINRNGHSAAMQMNTFLHWFEQLRGKLVAGVVSGPKSKLLANLITLSEAESLGTVRAPWNCISDTTLMSYGLEIGQRSAIFLHGNARNRQLCDSKAGIYFFFLRTRKYEIQRIEIPEWVARDSAAVDIVHASVLKSSENLGYPIVLAQAHYLVTIPLENARHYHSLASGAFAQHGGRVYVSAKNLMKGL